VQDEIQTSLAARFCRYTEKTVVTGVQFSAEAKVSLYYAGSRPALVSTHPPIKWIKEALRGRSGLFHKVPNFRRRAVAQLVEALRYKPERHGFDSRWCHWNFSMTYRFGRTMALGSTQPLTEMSTRNISWGVKAAGA
jgi:hypothetical protein